MPDVSDVVAGNNLTLGRAMIYVMYVTTFTGVIITDVC